MITSISNVIVNDGSWDPNTLKSPLQHLIPPTVGEPDGVQFEEQALPLSVTSPTSGGCHKVDVFNNYLIW